MSGKSNHSKGLIAAAVGYQWLYNGANYIAFKVGVEALPPFLLSAMRFSAAAFLVLPFALWRLRKAQFPSIRQLALAALIGIIMLVGSQGVSIWGVQYLPAGVAAVFGSAAPLWLALFAWLLLHQPLGKRQLVGVAIGFAGLGLMAFGSTGSGDFKLIGAIAVLGATAAWAGGSLLAEKVKLPEDSVIGLETQLLAAGALLCLIALVRGDFSGTDYAAVPGRAWWALAFLVIASTVIGYALFLWLNQTVSNTLANTFFYVAPVIAMGLSALFLDEPLTWLKGAAAGVALIGVALMVTGPDPRSGIENEEK